MVFAKLKKKRKKGIGEVGGGETGLENGAFETYICINFQEPVVSAAIGQGQDPGYPRRRLNLPAMASAQDPEICPDVKQIL